MLRYAMLCSAMLCHVMPPSPMHCLANHCRDKLCPAVLCCATLGAAGGNLASGRGKKRDGNTCLPSMTSFRVRWDVVTCTARRRHVYGGTSLSVRRESQHHPFFGPVLSPSWAYLGASWGQVGPKMGLLGPIWGHVAAFRSPPGGSGKAS